MTAKAAMLAHINYIHFTLGVSAYLSGKNISFYSDENLKNNLKRL